LLTDHPQGDWILFTHEGGVDVGDVDAKAEKLLIPVDLTQYPSNEEIAATLLKNVPKGVHNVLVDFSKCYCLSIQSQV
jgi:ATP citrate (pro-S)-lyase